MISDGTSSLRPSQVAIGPTVRCHSCMIVSPSRYISHLAQRADRSPHDALKTPHCVAKLSPTLFRMDLLPSNNFTTVSWRTAVCRIVYPSSDITEILAPHLRRISTISTSPCIVAQRSAVSLVLSLIEESPCLAPSNRSATTFCPKIAAK